METTLRVSIRHGCRERLDRQWGMLDIGRRLGVQPTEPSHAAVQRPGIGRTTHRPVAPYSTCSGPSPCQSDPQCFPGMHIPPRDRPTAVPPSSSCQQPRAVPPPFCNGRDVFKVPPHLHEVPVARETTIRSSSTVPVDSHRPCGSVRICTGSRRRVVFSLQFGSHCRSGGGSRYSDVVLLTPAPGGTSLLFSPSFKCSLLGITRAVDLSGHRRWGRSAAVSRRGHYPAARKYQV